MRNWYDVCTLKREEIKSDPSNIEERISALEEELIESLIYLEQLKTNLDMQRDQVKSFARFLIKNADENGFVNSAEIPNLLKEWVIKHD